MWSSWCLGWDSSTLGLVDSWDSTLQPYLDFGSCDDALTLCSCRQKAMFAVSFTGHGGCHWSFQISPRILHSIVMFFIWINEVNCSQLSSIFSNLGFSIAHSWVFSVLRGFSNSGPYFRPHMIRSGNRLNFCQSPCLVQINVPIIVNTISICSPGDINKFKWNRESSFFRHTELNSRFIAQSSWQFCCTICKWENKFVSFQPDQYLLGVNSLRINIWCIQNLQFFQICNQKVSFT